MKIGVTGHQERVDIDWIWVKEVLTRLLGFWPRIEGYSSLAVGTDQLFANVVLGLGGANFAVIPFDNYRFCFEEHATEYDRLLVLSKQIDLKLTTDHEQSFLDAGKWIVRSVDLMIAVWDGELAEGKGGTADIVKYAAKIKKPLFHLEPLSKNIKNKLYY